MKINKQILKQIIKEALDDTEAKLKSGVMTGGQFTTGGREQRKEVEPEVDNNERSLIHQIDAFLLKLAGLPGVELMKHRATLQTVLKTLEKRIGSSATAEPQPEQGEQ